METNGRESDPRVEGIGRLYGTEALARFGNTHIAIVGIGGVGSWAAEAMARSGIGTLTLMDLDDICVSNTNRQIHALTSSIGRSKIAAMAGRLRDIRPSMEIHEEPAFFSESTAETFLATPFDWLVDAIDAVSQKALLLAGCLERGIPVVTIGGMGGRIDPSRIQKADLANTHGDPLLAQVRKRLRSQFQFPPAGKGKFKIPTIFSDEPPRLPDTCQREEVRGMNCDTGFGAVTHVTATAAFYAVAHVLNTIGRDQTA